MQGMPPRLSMPASPNPYGPSSPVTAQYAHFVASPADYSQQQHPFGAGGGRGAGAGQHASTGGGYGQGAFFSGPSPPHQPFYSPGYGQSSTGRSHPSVGVASPSSFHQPYFPPTSSPMPYTPTANSPTLTFAPHPLRSKLGHASTPSFVPPSAHHRRPGSISLRPHPSLKSPTLSRSGSTSPGLAIAPEKEEKKRKVMVRVPREDEGVEKGRKRSSIQRAPLGEKAKRRKLESMAEDEEAGDVLLEGDELVSREQHFEEVKMVGLPESIDVYLPGKSAWEEVREMINDEMKERFGAEASSAPSDRQLFANRIHSFHDLKTPSPQSPVPTANQGHFRTGSLFSTPSSFPPRLQTALDTFARGIKGHSPSASMGGPLTRSFAMPTWGASKPSPSATPLPESPSVGLAPGYFPPVAQTPSPSIQGASPATPLSNARGRRLTLAELSRGFGVTEEEEEEEEEGPRHSVSSRRNSGMSVKTGVASLSDIATDSAEERSDAEIVTNPSDEEEEQRTRNLKQSLHLHSNSLGTEALAMKRAAMGRVKVDGNYSGEEGGYDGSEDGEGELSEEEYVNASEEDRARRRAEVRARSRSALQKPEAQKAYAPPSVRGDDESNASGGLEAPEDHLIFQAPSDVDRSPVVENVVEQSQEKGSHKVTTNFSFPPKTPPRLLPPTRGADNHHLDPTPSIDRLDLSAASLATPAPPPIFTKSLNVAAPEFVFGGAPKTKELRVIVSPTFGRKSSTTSLGSAGLFGPFGAPGSLTVDSPTLSPPSTSISPSAPEFLPAYKATNPDPPSEDPTPSPELVAPKSSTFDFRPPVDAPTLVIPPPLTRNPSSSRGPLPPIPLTSVTPHSISVKRQKVDAESTRHVYFSGSSTASQTLHTLPHFSPPRVDARHAGTPSSSLSDQESNTNDDPAEQSFASTTGGDDPLPEQYAPVQNLGRSFTSSGRPFTLRPAASFSSDGRVVGFTTRRPPIPQFGGPAEKPGSEGNASNRTSQSPSDLGGRSRTGSRAREESVDDIALPSGLRPKSQAIAIPQRVDRNGSGSAIEEDGEEDVFGSDAMPLTPESASDEGEDEDDYPLRILEDIISTQFEGLREELSGLTSLKEDIDSLKGEAVLDALVARLERVISDARTADADERTSALKTVVDEGQKRTEDALLGAIQDLKAQYQASRMVVTAPTSPTAASVDFSEDLRDSLVEAVSKAMHGRLLPPPVEATRDLKEELRGVVEAAIQPLTNILTSNTTAVAPDEPRADLLTKLDTSLAALLAQTETLAISLTTSASLNTTERASLVEELHTTIESISLQPPRVNVDADDLVFRLALAIQPQLNGIFERFGDKKKETAEYLVEQLRPVVEASRTVETSAAVEQEKLVEALVERIEPLFVSAASSVVTAGRSAPFDLESLVERIAAARPREEVWATRFDSLQKALEDGRRSSGPGDTIMAALDTLQKDLTARFDASDKLIAEQISALSASQAPSDRIAELEAQLIQTRNDHSAVRSENTTLLERLEADRTRCTTEIDTLKTDVLDRDAAAKEAELERRRLTQTVERLQAELTTSQSSNEQLAVQLAQSQKKVESLHSAELKHLSDLSAHQAQSLALSASVDSAQSRIALLEGDLEQMRKEKEEMMQEKKSVDRVFWLEREQAAVARGEIVGLEKRVAEQDNRLLTLARAKAVQQTLLSRANLRITSASSQISSLTSHNTSLSAALEASESTRLSALKETEAYRERFEVLEKDLAAMKEVLRGEVEETEGRLRELAREREEMRGERDEARMALAMEREREHALLAPRSIYGYSQPTLLRDDEEEEEEEDDDAGSEGTIHEGVSHLAVSPTPSLGGKSISVDDSGWWSSS